MKAIIRVPQPVLTIPAKPVAAFDKRLKRLVTDLKQTLLAATNPKGVGLAAPQIGEPYRVFVTKPKDDSRLRVFVNPEVIKRSPELTDGVPQRDNKLEGCLSIPKIWGKLARNQSLTLRYQDETGAVHKEKFGGFLATIIQHELDHLDGILFTRRVLEQKGKLYQPATDKAGKAVLAEIELI